MRHIADEVAAINRIFPHRKPRARRSPCIHYIFKGTQFVGDPLDETEDRRAK